MGLTNQPKREWECVPRWLAFVAVVPGPVVAGSVPHALCVITGSAIARHHHQWLVAASASARPSVCLSVRLPCPPSYVFVIRNKSHDQCRVLPSSLAPPLVRSFALDTTSTERSAVCPPTPMHVPGRRGACCPIIVIVIIIATIHIRTACRVSHIVNMLLCAAVLSCGGSL